MRPVRPLVEDEGIEDDDDEIVLDEDEINLPLMENDIALRQSNLYNPGCTSGLGNRIFVTRGPNSDLLY